MTSRRFGRDGGGRNRGPATRRPDRRGGAARPGNSAGARPATAVAMMRARGRMPYRSSAASLATTNAAAPSASVDALAAVIVPSRSKLGRRSAMRAKSTRSGSSSASTVDLPLRPGTRIATISSAKAPDAAAAWARR